MGSPVSTVVANLVIEDNKKKPCQHFTFHQKSGNDDTFVIINKNSVEDFWDHLNAIENNQIYHRKRSRPHTSFFRHIGPKKLLQTVKSF